MRRAVAITLSKNERTALTKWARSRSAPVRLVVRAKMILLAAKGWENLAIAAELDVHRVTVAAWRRRFAAERLAGIEHERPGRGRRATKRKHWARTIIEVTLHTTPKDATHWSVRSLAKHLGIDKSLVMRVWQAHELAPHRVRTFKLSRDKRFIEKL
ncbi:MAG: helix-turn-helix domain-containing protein, partial [bacterium]|nr:helix-turn-helix domain-containing protein [bacterium]